MVCAPSHPRTKIRSLRQPASVILTRSPMLFARCIKVRVLCRMQCCASKSLLTAAGLHHSQVTAISSGYVCTFAAAVVTSSARILHFITLSAFFGNPYGQGEKVVDPKLLTDAARNPKCVSVRRIGPGRLSASTDATSDPSSLAEGRRTVFPSNQLAHHSLRATVRLAP